ncbi:MAG: DUF2339 domain-containing protein [Hyphomonadaceae bacterium]|nr:DUF2339 domain-containing protein [Hyphomonadaceae bacterium]
MDAPPLLVAALAVWAIWQTLQTGALARRLSDAERMIVDLAALIDRSPGAAPLVLETPAAAAPPAPLRIRMERTLARKDVALNLGWAGLYGSLVAFAFALHPLWGVIALDASAGTITATLLAASGLCILCCLCADEIGFRHDDAALRGAGAVGAAAHGVAGATVLALYLMRGAEMVSDYPLTPAHWRGLSLLWIACAALVYAIGALGGRVSLRRFGAALAAVLAVKLVLFDMHDADAGLRAFLFLSGVLAAAWAALTRKPGVAVAA